MAELGAQEAMAVQGAQEAMAGGLSLQPEPFYPPKKKFPGEVRGYQEPSGARQTGQYMTGQDRTGQPSGARQTGQDIPQEPGTLLGWLGSWGFLWAWQGVRGPHRVPQQPLPLLRQGGRRLEWPPRPQQEEPPAPDESPRTRQDKVLFKMFLWAQQDTNTALLAVTCGLDPRG